jgi:hypothetical protein
MLQMSFLRLRRSRTLLLFLLEEFLPSEKSFFKEEAFSVFATSYYNILKQKANDPMGNVWKELSELKASQAETTRALYDLIKQREVTH